MENSHANFNETFTEICPPRRRSTFFDRRSLGVDNPESRQKDQNSLDNNEKQRHESKQYCEEEIKKYYQQLLEEKSKWKLEVKARKTKCNELQMQHALCSDSNTYAKRYNYSILSEEDIKFLKGKPNIAKIKENVIELAEDVHVTLRLHSKLRDLQTKILDRCEQESMVLQKYILDNSSIE